MVNKLFFRPGKAMANEKGVILLTTYVVVVVVAVFCFAFFSRSGAFMQAVERNQNKTVAFNMAEAGVAWAAAQLNANPDYAGTSAFVPLDTATTTGGFTATITTPANNDMIRIIQAAGFAPDNDPTSRAYQTSNITVYSQYQPSNLFDYAIFSKDNITLTGPDKTASIDSYDSRLGPYDPATAGSDGDIAVNNSEAGSIIVRGKTVVDGDVYVGPEGDPDTGIVIGPNATINGTTAPSSGTQVYTDPSTPVPSSGELDISSGEQFLLPGTYHYSSLSISGTGQLTATGPVEIYVDGDVAITGNGFATQDNLPENLLIFVIGSGTVSIGGNGTLYGGVYAPDAEVRNVGNGAVYGAVVADRYVQTGNSVIHYDVALKEIESEQRLGEIEAIAWQEQNSLTWGT